MVTYTREEKQVIMEEYRDSGKSKYPTLPKTIKPATVFATENMRIELKEGFDKKLLRQ